MQVTALHIVIHGASVFMSAVHAYSFGFNQGTEVENAAFEWTKLINIFCYTPMNTKCPLT